MLSSHDNSGMGGWGAVIFFLILFWLFGGAFGNRCGGWGNNCDPCGGTRQSERDVLQLATASVEQNAAIQKTLAEIAYAQQMGFASVKEGQKDLYIRDLERIATNQFITSQTEALANKMDALAAAGALQRQADQAAVQAQIAGISCQMLKAPQVQPLVGLGTLNCTNAAPYCGGCFNG